MGIQPWTSWCPSTDPHKGPASRETAMAIARLGKPRFVGIGRGLRALLAAALLMPLPVHAFLLGLSGVTLRDSGTGCAPCHATDTSMAVTITGPAALNASQFATYTVTALKTSAAHMGVDIASSDTNALSLVAGQPTVLIGANGNEITHSSAAGALPTAAGGSASYQFTFTMPAGAPVGSDHTLYS